MDRCLWLWTISNERKHIRSPEPMLGLSLTTYTVLKAETETCMRLLGVERVDQLGMHLVSATLRSTQYLC